MMQHMATHLGQLGKLARGSINPSEQEQALSIAAIQANLNALYVSTDSKIVSSCIDGRSAAVPTALTPNAAGGSLALWVAAALSGYLTSPANFFAALTRAGIELGGHTDSHAHAEATGCGANDKMPAIVELLSVQSLLAGIDEVLAVMEAACDNAAALVAAAAAFSTSDFLLNAPARLAPLKQHGTVAELCGNHTEKVILVNMVRGTTLDRAALSKVLGPDASAFNVDAWAIRESALSVQSALVEQHALTEAPFATATFCSALAAFNVATALTLCGAEMPLLKIVATQR